MLDSMFHSIYILLYFVLISSSRPISCTILVLMYNGDVFVLISNYLLFVSGKPVPYRFQSKRTCMYMLMIPRTSWLPGSSVCCIPFVIGSHIERRSLLPSVTSHCGSGQATFKYANTPWTSSCCFWLRLRLYWKSTSLVHKKGIKPLKRYLFDSLTLFSKKPFLSVL